MDLEGRKSNIYFDQTGKQILVGDLLKVYHFGRGNKTKYMYLIPVMEDGEFPVMSLRCYTKNKPHYRLYVACDNEQRVYFDAKIINMYDWQTKRKCIKINPIS